MSSLVVDGKEYKLVEAYTIDPDDVDIRWAADWGEEDTYEVDVATDTIAVKRCYVLVEKSPEEISQDYMKESLK